MGFKSRQAVVRACRMHSLVSVILMVSISGDGAISSEKTKCIDSVGVVIENISHSGKDNYRIQIALTNNHSEVLSLREFDRQFHVQTETGWIRLNEAPTQGSLSEKDLYFPALGKKTIVTAVEIPLNMPGLFRTYEGDISLSFRYRLVLTGDGETREHESLFWITPMTDTWLEREGM